MRLNRAYWALFVFTFALRGESIWPLFLMSYLVFYPRWHPKKGWGGGGYFTFGYEFEPSAFELKGGIECHGTRRTGISSDLHGFIVRVLRVIKCKMRVTKVPLPAGFFEMRVSELLLARVDELPTRSVQQHSHPI